MVTLKKNTKYIQKKKNSLFNFITSSVFFKLFGKKSSDKIKIILFELNDCKVHFHLSRTDKKESA